MKACIITIGDEILLGQILDTNSRFIARELAAAGTETVEMRSVSDGRDEILHAVDDAMRSADAVFVTGGLGPTKDDVTKSALADYFGTEMAHNPQAQQWLEEIFAANLGRMNAYNQTQAWLPKSCTPLHNIKGTASGMWFEKDGKVLVSLPGVPFETEYLFPAEVMPRIRAKFGERLLRYKMVTVFDIPEAELAMKLAAFEEILPKGVGLAYLPSAGLIRLRLTAKGPAAESLDGLVEQLLNELSGLRFTEQAGENEEESFARRLRQSGKTVACAESCTGGNIARMITAVPGASAYFLGGVVAYANRVKQNVLGVRAEDLEAFGAIRKTVAMNKAEGVRRVTGADYAVSTTGIAGPDGGTPGKPVGTVWIAVAGPNGSHAEKFTFSRTRERNIGRASVKAISLMLEEMEK